MKDNLISLRGLLAGVGSAAALSLMPRAASAAASDGFSFVFLTDSHIQPELGAAEGVKKAVAAKADCCEKLDGTARTRI